VPRLVRVAATWVLSKQNPGSPPVTDVQETKTAVPKTPPLLDPAKDDAPKWIADDAKVGTRDRVTCICDVELENGELRQAKIENKVLTLHHSHVFKLGRLAFSSPDFRVTLEQA
jgi:hypothetical protein